MRDWSFQHPSRRDVLAAAAGMGLAAVAARADESADLGLTGGPSARPLTSAFPQKGRMILQRTRPPLLETPFDVFDQGTITPNDRFFVRWHWSMIPTSIDVDAFRLTVRGAVDTPLSLSLADLQALPNTEIVAVNQCSGNSRGFFQPRVAGGQWGNGAMGNARWGGVALRQVLDRAGVRAGAIAVRFDGLDEPPVPDAPDFRKSLAIDHARDGEVMLAWSMNDEPLPLLNGLPLRLVVPGWYSTYWVKMLSDIEVLAAPDDNFWMAKAYTIPDTPHASVRPTDTGYHTVPINRMVPRSFVTNLRDGAVVPAGAAVSVRGLALGGDCGVARVDYSADGGASWRDARLGADEGRYGFRRWEASFTPDAGAATLRVRCTNTAGVAQPDQPNWNPSGFMRNVIETLRLVAR